jgi:hypothetical protein
MEVGIKCADLNNPTKSLELSLEWSVRIMEEFYPQGDQEKEAGLAVSNFMNRQEQTLAKCQLAFMELLVLPLFSAWDGHCSTEESRELIRNIHSNRTYSATNPTASHQSLTAGANMQKQTSNLSMKSSGSSASRASAFPSHHASLMFGRLAMKRASFKSAVTIPKIPITLGFWGL